MTTITEEIEKLEKERDEYRAALLQLKADIEFAYDPKRGPDSAEGWTNTTHRHGSAETAHIYASVCSSLGRGMSIHK